MQFAGNTGLVSAGAGREFRKWFSADINLGYLPKHVNGVRVFTFSVRPVVTVKTFRITGVEAAYFFGSGINYSIGRKIFGRIPDYYPQDYYWPNAFHFTPFTGLRVGLGKQRRVFLYSELGTVDYKIWFAAKNREVNIFEILDLDLGIIIRRGEKKAE